MKHIGEGLATILQVARSIEGNRSQQSDELNPDGQICEPVNDRKAICTQKGYETPLQDLTKYLLRRALSCYV